MLGKLYKLPLDMSVYEAATSRLSEAFEHYDALVLSFSGGKDSSVMFSLMQEMSLVTGKPFHVVYFDEEIIDPDTERYIDAVEAGAGDMYQFHRLCVPVRHSLRSQERSYWQTWERSQRHVWFREPPAGAVTEDFFGDYFATPRRFSQIAKQYFRQLFGSSDFLSLLGLRASESVSRRLAIATTLSWLNKRELPHQARPIYDWANGDVWHYLREADVAYSAAYDKMARLGVSQLNWRLSTWGNTGSSFTIGFYRQMYPEAWNRALKRLPELDTMFRYGDNVLRSRPYKPAGMTWRDLVMLQLSMLDEDSRKVWTSMIKTRLHDWRLRSSLPFPDVEPYKHAFSWRHFATGIHMNELARGRPRQLY